MDDLLAAAACTFFLGVGLILGMVIAERDFKENCYLLLEHQVCEQILDPIKNS